MLVKKLLDNILNHRVSRSGAHSSDAPKESAVFCARIPINLYSLDFAILDLKIDIEIDGDQHYLDDRIVESDKKRTLYLESNGWKVLRIKWSDYQKLNFEEKEIFVKDFIAMIKSPPH